MGAQVYIRFMTEAIATESPISPALLETDGPSEAVEAPDEVAAPFGWMTDPDTGERRPKKRPGRRSKAARMPPGKTPALEELQALGTLSEASEDTPPGTPPKGRRKTTAMKAAAPPFRAGVISKGMNKLYAKAGRIVRVFDMEIGTAVIACTRAEDDDDVTVGDAWEELARTNPRIRAFLMRLMVGGAWSALFTAHLPILMAIAMKDGIRQRIPFLGLAQTLLTDEPDDGGEAVPSDLAQMMGGIGPEDMAQMMAVAQGLMGQMAAGVPRAPNMPPRGPVNGAPWPQEAPREHPADPE